MNLNYENNIVSSKSNYSDEDEDSLGCALNDYNGVFYDAVDFRKSLTDLNNVEVKSQSSESTQPTDYIEEDDIEFVLNSSGIEDDDEKCEASKENLNPEIEKIKEKNEISIELENYLNSDNDCDYLSNYDTAENNENLQLELSLKLSKLESFNFDLADLNDLKKLAIEKFGFINKNYRRKAWAKLILNKCNFLSNQNNSFVNQLNTNSNPSLQSSKFDQITEKQIKANKYFNQVTLDVVRTLKRFPPEISENLRLKLQDELISLICKILVEHENLHYYQGYHDICLTFLLVTGVQESLSLIENLTLSHLTLFMETTMESTLKQLFNIMPLIDSICPKVAGHLQRAELGVIFGLSWLITWYSHVMDDLTIILRLYDFFIATDPLMPIYLGAIIVTDKAEEILNIDCDMASLHTVISKYPSNIKNIDSIENYINKSLELFEQHPPSSLPILNENWLEKCRLIQIEKEKQEEEFRNAQIRKRRSKATRSNKKSTNRNFSNNNESDCEEEIDSKNKSLVLRKSHLLRNRMFMGLTFTVGVAAVAMYAISSNPKEPQELISKVFQLLTYKDFL